MCILFIALNQHPDYPLIIAANRDEFHQRPTKASQFWPKYPQLLAGQDLTAKGTWMGICKTGKLAALTNIRAPGKERVNAVSRGELVVNYLGNNISNQDYLNNLQSTREQYNGYNLLFGNFSELYVYNNFENSTQKLNDGVYGLSNASLNSPWPKLNAGKSALANYCQQANKMSREHLFELLKNDQEAKDIDLPKTGIPIEWERKLSSIFITGPDYGTRSSTVLMIDKHNHCFWEERTFSANTSLTNTQIYEFYLQQNA